jgi:hypothetical protein
MSLWIVWNGWVGAASTGALVEAPDREAALAAGSAALRAEAEQPAVGRDGPTYPESYWHPGRLTVERVSLPLVGSFDIPTDDAAEEIADWLTRNR